MAEKLEFDLAVQKNDLNKALDEGIKKSSKLEDTLSTALAVFGGNLITKGFDAFTGGLSSLISLGGDAIDAAAGQEAATNNLNNALARAGNLSKEASVGLAVYASQLQATSVFEDDAALAAAALLQSLTKLNAEGLKQGVTAAADFATVLGIDLETATRLVAKAAAGNTEAFKRYGLEIAKGANDTESFANTIKALNTQFGGAANSQLNTFSGSLTSLKNAYGDLLEPVGEIVVKNPLIVASFNAIKDILNDTGSAVSENNQVFKDLVADGIFAAIAASQVLFDALDGITIGVKALGNSALVVNGAIQFGIIEPFKLAIDAAIKLGSFLPFVGDAIASLENPLSTTSEQIRSNLTDALDGLKNSADNNIFRTLSDQTGVFADKIIESSAKIAQASAEATDSNKNKAKQIEEENAAILEKRKQLGIEIAALNSQLAAEELSFNQSLLDQKIANEDERKIAELQTILDTESAKLEALTQAELAKTDLIKNESEKRLTQDKIIADSQIKAIKLQNTRELAEQKILADAKKKLDDERIKNQSDTFASIATLSSANNRTLASIGKAAGITQIAIDTPVAIGKALAAFPPPFNFAAAGLVGAAMAAQAARIAGVGFESGGIVGQGASVGPDNRVAAIRDGELVLNANQQKTLFDAISSGNLGGGQIIVQIDGKTIATAIRDQIRGGFQLA